MSDKYTYIGPYIIATVNIKEVETDLCEKHNFPKDANFCPKCGRSKSQRYVKQTVSDTPDFWEEDYPKGHLDDFLLPNHHIEYASKEKSLQFYFPNKFQNEISFIDSCDDYLKFEITPEKIQKSLDQFETLFKDEIEYMKQWFDIQIIYGVVKYAC